MTVCLIHRGSRAPDIASATRLSIKSAVASANSATLCQKFSRSSTNPSTVRLFGCQSCGALLRIQRLAHRRALGLDHETSRKLDAQDFQSGGRSSHRMPGPNFRSLLNSSVHASRLQVETGEDSCPWMNQPRRRALSAPSRKATSSQEDIGRHI
jgi:hypothetical protein